MSWAFCDTRAIKKTRKPHKCDFCGRIIPKGSIRILNWKGLWDGEFQNSYACNWCNGHQDRLVDDWDNSMLDFWDCLREDIFYDEFCKYKECDCLDEQGFLGNIKPKLDGDYLIFKCEDCGKEWHRIHMPISEIANEQRGNL